MEKKSWKKLKTKIVKKIFKNGKKILKKQITNENCEKNLQKRKKNLEKKIKNENRDKSTVDDQLSFIVSRMVVFPVVLLPLVGMMVCKRSRPFKIPAKTVQWEGILVKRQ